MLWRVYCDASLGDNLANIAAMYQLEAALLDEKNKHEKGKDKIENKIEDENIQMAELSDEQIKIINLHNGKYRVIPISFRDIGTNVRGGERSSYIKKKVLGTPLDYVRYRVMGQCAEEIKRKQVAGAVAELGVFRGAFARKINEVLTDRLLYLYDTFTGFDDRDMVYQPEAMKASWYDLINDGSKMDLVGYIKSVLPNPEQAVFRKSYFPNTAEGDDKLTFCFVSIDADIYKPTLEALKFFYPRLNPGGYIFIRDGKFDGVQRALQEFEAENGFLSLVPLCDQSESYVICKGEKI